MASKVQVSFVDDITGEDIKPGDEAKLPLGFEGHNYELDVSKATYDEVSSYIRTLLANVKPVRKGRKPSPTVITNGNGKAPVNMNGNRADTAAIRAWAVENGHQVKGRGRISADIISAYEAAMSGS